LQAADDEAIFQFAKNENHILISADTDFGTMLALGSQRKPVGNPAEAGERPASGGAT
jgi:predicted nuclease of predicted toxin-antitoxin system